MRHGGRKHRRQRHQAQDSQGAIQNRVGHDGGAWSSNNLWTLKCIQNEKVMQYQTLARLS